MSNVAGYDFCKLLCGSLGTLAVVTQLALKLKPRPDSSATIVAAVADLATADILLARLVGLPAPPVAIGSAPQLLDRRLKKIRGQAPPADLALVACAAAVRSVARSSRSAAIP